MSDPSGIPFGSYRLIRRLALGGMAEVFLARQTGLEGFDRLCAVKRILPHLASSQEFVDMFLDEARLATQLSHPNVVHIYDFGKVDDAYFIAMEYVDGVAAGRLIEHAAHEPLPVPLIARIGAGACAGLDHAHNLRDVDGKPLALVHRDVSPPNLLVSYEGAVKLVDFGIAKAESSIEQTRPGVIKGKYAYMSPEQTVGRPLDGRSDVFSLGLVLWELLAGRPAVRRDDPIEGMKQIRDGVLPRLESVRPGTPTELASALTAALAPEPENRLSALELGLSLERFIKSSSGISSNLELAQWLRSRFPRQQAKTNSGPGPTREATAATGHFGGALTEVEQRIPVALDESTELTEVSPPMFTESALAGPTTIAIGLDSKRPKPRASRALLVTSGVGLLAALVLTVTTLKGSGERESAAPKEPTADAGIVLASLEILAKPAGATVTVDGEDVVGPVELAPGRYQLRVSKRGYKDHERTVELAEGERRSVELVLTRKRTAASRPSKRAAKDITPADEPAVKEPVEPAAKGKLRVRSQPYAVVYLGSRKLGITPLNVELSAGKHRIRLVNPKSGAEETHTVTIQPDELTPLSIKLK